MELHPTGLQKQKEYSLSVYELIGEYALRKDEGLVLYCKIKELLAQYETVVLDFSKVYVFASSFGNYAIAQLLNEFPSLYLENHLKIINITEYEAYVIKTCNQNAKRKIEEKV